MPACYNKAEIFSLLEELGVTPIIAMGRGERESEQNATERLTEKLRQKNGCAPKVKS